MRYFIYSFADRGQGWRQAVADLANMRLGIKNVTQCPHTLVVVSSGEFRENLQNLLYELAGGTTLYEPHPDSARVSEEDETDPPFTRSRSSPLNILSDIWLLDYQTDEEQQLLDVVNGEAGPGDEIYIITPNGHASKVA